ncbi:MAG: PhnD/SsuA/transferrin family substrate-binding protein [Alphaproteobacteria bacterium]|nr:PhnD/SsuA/transferrin family substrate-binding protein [Alphaproteobacteria bacterium]
MGNGNAALTSAVARRMRRAKYSAVTAVLGVSVLAFSAFGAAAETKIVFGAYSSDKPSAMIAQVHPTLDAIAKKMMEMYGEKVSFRMQIVRGYKKGVDHLVAKKFDIMRLGPASYVMAKKRAPQITILAMENKHGKKTFNGIIAVHKDSTLTSLDQLRGRTFAFGSKRSTLGRFFAQLTLTEAGVLAKDLARFEYLGRHDKVGRAVGAKLFEAGALEGTTFAKLVRKGVPIRALAKFSNATRPWIVREGMNPGLADKIRKAMLAVTDKAATRALRFDGFLPGDDSDYAPTRMAIQENHLFFEGFTGFKTQQQSRR